MVFVRGLVRAASVCSGGFMSGVGVGLCEFLEGVLVAVSAFFFAAGVVVLFFVRCFVGCVALWSCVFGVFRFF